MKEIKFQEQRSFSANIDSTFAFFTGNFKIFFKTIAILTLPIVIVGAIISALYQTELLNNMPTKTYTSLHSIYNVKYFASVFILALANLFVMSATYSYVFVYMTYGKNNITIFKVFEVMRNNIGMVIFTSLLLGLIYILIAIPSIILLEIPLIYFSILTVFVVPARIFETNSFIEAIKRSMFLVKGRWWFTFGLIIVISMGVYFINSFLQMPIAFFSVGKLFKIFTGDNSQIANIIFICYSILVTMFTSLMSSIIYISLALQFFNLIEEKENPSMREKIKELEQSTNFQKLDNNQSDISNY